MRALSSVGRVAAFRYKSLPEPCDDEVDEPTENGGRSDTGRVFQLILKK